MNVEVTLSTVDAKHFAARITSPEIIYLNHVLRLGAQSASNMYSNGVSSLLQCTWLILQASIKLFYSAVNHRRRILNVLLRVTGVQSAQFTLTYCLCSSVSLLAFEIWIFESFYCQV